MTETGISVIDGLVISVKRIWRNETQVSKARPGPPATSCSYVLPSIQRVPKENLSKCIRASSCCRVQALFFEVTAEKADQLCSTS